MSTRTLSDVQCDVVGELFNLGMGRAAASLSEMLAREVLLSVPRVELINRAQVRERYFEQGLRRVTAVTQGFNGPFTGESFLLFPDSEGLRLAMAMLDDGACADEASEIAQDVIAEIGNIVLNACLGSIGNIFGAELSSGLPELRTDECSVVLGGNEADAALFLQIEFAVANEQIRGFVAFLIDVGSTDEFCRRIDELASSL